MSSKLRSIRAGHRSVISRLLKKFEDIRDDGDEPVNTEELTKILNNLLKKQETLQKLNEDILENLDEGEVEAEIVDSDEYAYTLDGKITQIQKLILVNTSALNTNAKDFVSYSGPSHSAPAQPAHDQPSYAQPAHDQPSYAQPERCTKQNTCNSNFREPETQFSRSKTRVNRYNKLPKLNLPTFDGNIMQWQSFWDSYETSVHENTTLGNVQKFNYLKSLLHDEALKTVTGFALTHANYEKAISLLQERYGQSHVIRQKYMQALVDIPAPKYTISSMKNYYDEIEIHIRGLESLGQSEHTCGAFLVPIIMNKLPGEIRRNLARQYRSTD
ncbi:uncharacterized protein [Mytilus edulis]|uniref:uncharacterized protein n=1 Tax=Mytilus edulis TaxID=6550 RepID=UPI0039EFC180